MSPITRLTLYAPSVIIRTFMIGYSLTKPERRLVVLLRWWIVLFAIAGIGFAVIPDLILDSLNIIGHSIFKWRGPPIEPSSERFWLVLACSLMVTLIVSAVKAQADIKQNIFYVIIILIAKLTSTIGFLIALLLISHSFGYLIGAVVDGLIFVITLIYYIRASASRPV